MNRKDIETQLAQDPNSVFMTPMSAATIVEIVTAPDWPVYYGGTYGWRMRDVESGRLGLSTSRDLRRAYTPDAYRERAEALAAATDAKRINQETLNALVQRLGLSVWGTKAGPTTAKSYATVTLESLLELEARIEAKR